MIGLEDVMYLVAKHSDELRFVRVLACDVNEICLLAGKSQVLPRRKLLIGVTPGKDGHLSLGLESGRTSAHIIPNGILEVHNGRFMGGISAWKGVELAEAARGERKEVFALVGVEREGELYKELYWFYAEEGKWWVLLTDDGGSTWEDLQHLEPEWWLETLDSQECLHRFVQYGITGMGERTKLIERCDYCDAVRERPAPPEEQLNLEDYGKLHETAHAFERLFREDDDAPPMALEVHGYEAMEKAEAFATEHPHDVQIVGVDDACFSTSDLVLINHRGDRRFMGTTVYVIPQNGGNGAEFFLYPEHRKALARALDLIDRQQAADSSGDEDDDF